MKKLIFWMVFLSMGSSLLSFATLAPEEERNQKQKTVAENLVNEASHLIKERGQDAFNVIRDKNGKFCTQNSYVFVVDAETGSNVANPSFPEFEGLSVEKYHYEYQRKAKEIIVDAVKDRDSAWVEYLWPKPNEREPSRKFCYLKKIVVDGKALIIAAGFYPHPSEE